MHTDDERLIRLEYLAGVLGWPMQLLFVCLCQRPGRVSAGCWRPALALTETKRCSASGVHNSRDCVCINWYATHGPGRGPHACWRCRPGDGVSPDFCRDAMTKPPRAESGLAHEHRVSRQGFLTSTNEYSGRINHINHLIKTFQLFSDT